MKSQCSVFKESRRCRRTIGETVLLMERYDEGRSKEDEVAGLNTSLPQRASKR
jgi:hypothetical protein